MTLRRAMFPTVLLLTLCASAGFVARAAEPAATTEPETAKIALPAGLEAALADAKKSGRDVVVVFNISDWTGWCEKLRSEILEQPEYATATGKEFVTVVLDYPQKTKIPDEQRKRNQAYAKKYHITGFPVVLLLDSAGRPYAKTGYKAGGAKVFAAHLADLKKERVQRDALIAKSRKSKGDLRAELLAGALRKIDGSLAPDYPELFEELRGVDPRDRRGVVLEYDITQLVNRARAAALQAHNQNAGLWEFDAFLSAHADIPRDKQQRVELERFAYVPRAGNDGLSRNARCLKRIEELRDMLALKPDSTVAPTIRKLIETEEAELAKLRAEALADQETE